MTFEGTETVMASAKTYTPAEDLWVVSTYFDSEGYTSKLRALRAYIRIMERSGIPLILVEGAFRKQPFLLPESEHIIHVRCPSVLWQKERLLNVGLDHLPASCRKVAWLDADVFFENPEWAVQTSELLERHPVVQPFDVALWLPRGATAFRGKGIAWPSFGAVARRHPGLFLSGDFDRHGHSGYAWAARRELIARHGLYDRSIAGSGDHLMAHAMMGDLWSPCVTNSVGADSPFRVSFEAWARPFHADVRSDMGFVSGALLHRWHGDRKERRYYKRMIGLLARGYDPARDVCEAPSGALEWTDRGSALARWMKDYFSGRKEDAEPGPIDVVPADFLESVRNDRRTSLDHALEPLLPLLGPLATLVSEREKEWEDGGLVPVLPYLVAALLAENGFSIQSPWMRLGVSADDGQALPPPTARSRGSGNTTVAMGPLDDRLEVETSEVARFAEPPRYVQQAPERCGPFSSYSIAAADWLEPMEAARTILNQVLFAARSARESNPHLWKRGGPTLRWCSLTGLQTAPSLVDELRLRLRDPRTRDAPELRSARARMSRRRARIKARRKAQRQPFDAVVGPGSSASGLDHV